MRLVECVPNFSEGRDKAKVDAIVAAMKMPGVYLLDREMDSDHNRCVITLVGEREPIQEAAIRGVGKAAEIIDLTSHTGAHPRMGAADVVPFIPIDGVTIEDCVAMARHVGEQIWKRFQIPVYLYEAAATSPERTNLENIRRGQFEGIRDEIATNPARRPDFGELRVHPTAGGPGFTAPSRPDSVPVGRRYTEREIAATRRSPSPGWVTDESGGNGAAPSNGSSFPRGGAAPPHPPDE